MQIEPVPTDEEAAAIVAAIEGAWPRATAAPTRDDSPRWRWSGRGSRRWWRGNWAMPVRPPRLRNA